MAPYMMLIMYMNMTMCVDFIKIIFYYLFDNNSQMTKVHNYISYNYTSSKYKSFLSTPLTIVVKKMMMQLMWMFIVRSMRLGISEITRYMFTMNYIMNYTYTYFKRTFINYQFASDKNINKTNYKQNIENVPIKNTDDYIFNTWLAGIIDGDGCFNLSKQGYASLEITMDIRDKEVLYLMKHKLGGSIKHRSGAKALRYRLHHKAGILDVINRINGLMRNSKRLVQLNKILTKYGILLKMPSDLKYNSGWLAGTIDSDGSIYYNDKSDQMFISMSQKDKYLLDNIQKVYGGKVYKNDNKTSNFKYSIYRKKDMLHLMDNYFSKYPLHSAKKHRLNLMKDFYLLKSKNYKSNPEKYDQFMTLINKWEIYGK
uniref:Homing endonuclease LAGLIDADG domain-containing protein n=1 Tax=Ogataea parapolymorpha (strain ATCC 26012 / BCRC 20466 / JCM 22074 / NRRL Y-7560 / DL-1) TaxID=871575 RepID=E7E843_OGAPD|nr:hypothetical protein HPOM_18 [Ogataea polymorpha]ADT63573.1 hypothetical protein HPOM_18 [Ogataea polymorpha]